MYVHGEADRGVGPERRSKSGTQAMPLSIRSGEPGFKRGAFLSIVI